MNFMLQRFNLTCARVRERMDTSGRSLRAAPSLMFGTYVGHHPYVKTGNKSRRDQRTLIVARSADHKWSSGSALVVLLD